MSETMQFSSNDIKSWLENETSAILTPVQEQAKKHRDDMRNAIESVTDVGKMLLDNSTKEIEKRNMRIYNRARAMNKLARLFTERIRKVNVPDQVSYDSLNKLAQDTQKVFMVTDIDIKNWFPRISPFFIMDRRKFLAIHEKAKESLAALNDFLTKEYVKTKTLEETFQLISELHNLENHLSEIEAEKASIKDERLPIEKEITDLEQKIAELQGEGPVDQLFLLETEIEKLNKELKHSLRHLQKPFKKLHALAFLRGGAGLTPDERNKLNQYLEKPFKGLSTEEAGYPLLKQILQKLARLIDEGKLKLKSDKKRKAEQAITAILNRDSLAAIYKQCAEIAARERQILNSAKMEEIKSSLSEYREQTKQLKARKTSVEAHEAVKERAYKETLDRISSHKRAIEKNVYSSVGQKIQIL
jgi:multidrug efflux pump subunit AcrA (membrane-fusion protein)